VTAESRPFSSDNPAGFGALPARRRCRLRLVPVKRSQHADPVEAALYIPEHAWANYQRDNRGGDVSPLPRGKNDHAEEDIVPKFVAGRIDLNCTDDRDALRQAEMLADTFGLELWEDDRMIAVFRKKKSN
jgi:hypothetical protein